MPAFLHCMTWIPCIIELIYRYLEVFIHEDIYLDRFKSKTDRGLLSLRQNIGVYIQTK